MKKQLPVGLLPTGPSRDSIVARKLIAECDAWEAEAELAELKRMRAELQDFLLLEFLKGA